MNGPKAFSCAAKNFAWQNHESNFESLFLLRFQLKSISIFPVCVRGEQTNSSCFAGGFSFEQLWMKRTEISTNLFTIIELIVRTYSHRNFVPISRRHDFQSKIMYIFTPRMTRVMFCIKHAKIKLNRGRRQKKT